MAQLLHPKKESIFDDDQLTAEDEIQIRNDLGKLSIAMIKAILQASFYKTDHKLTHAAVDDFFTALEPVQDLFLELTYMSSSDELKPDFTIEGLMVEPVNLTACVKTVLRDEFLGKLRDFFAWNKLVSFSIKREMTRDEFLRFLKLTRRKLGEKGEGPASWDELEGTPLEAEGHRLSDVLVESGLFTISATCRDEIVFVDRMLPWRVKLALGRLMKNLKDIPIYARATRKELQEIKALLLQEIIRPLRGRALLMEFLFNCDLVAQAGADDLQGLDIEEEVLAVLVRPQLLSVSNCFLAELERLVHDMEKNLERLTKGKGLLHKCSVPLSDMLDDETMQVFRRAAKGGFMKSQDLPANVQDHLELEKEVDKFLEDPDTTVALMESVKDMDGFRKHASNTALMVGELIRRGEYEWARKLVDLITYLADASAEVQAKVRVLARDVLDSMATKDNFERMISALPDLRPRAQDHVFHLCKTFRGRAVPVLVGELRGELDDSLRASIRTVLEQMGEDGAVRDFLRHGLERPKQRKVFYRDLLLILGALQDEGTYQLANTYLGDEESQVRQAAFTAVTRIGNKKAERDLVRGLADPDLGVRRAVVLHLGEIGSQSAEYREFLTRLFSGALSPGWWSELMAVIQREYDKVQLANHLLLNSGASALAHLLDSGVMTMAEVEGRLCKMMNMTTRYQLFGGGEDVVRERARLCKTIIGILRERGTAECLPALRQARDSASQDIHHLAKATLRTVMERENLEEFVPWQERALDWLKVFLGLKKERRPEPGEGEDEKE